MIVFQPEFTFFFSLAGIRWVALVLLPFRETISLYLVLTALSLLVLIFHF